MRVVASRRRRPTGIAAVARGGVRVFEWRCGIVEELARFSLLEDAVARRDRLERRSAERRAAFARSAAERLTRLGRARDWRELVVFDDRRVLQARDRTELARVVARALVAVRRDEEVVLAERVRAEALTGGAAALGIDETARALDDARVSHLLFACPRESAPVERMIERAYATRALVTPLGARAARVLDDVDGVAALLRW